MSKFLPRQSYVPKNAIKGLFPGHFSLGESPIWHPEYQKFFVVDIYGNKFCSICPKTNEKVDYEIQGDNISALVPAKGGLAATFSNGGFGKISFDADGKMTWKYLFDQPCAETKQGVTRYNDGKCCPKGRFVGGLMSHDFKSKEDSHIYILDKLEEGPKLFIPNVCITNGPTWSIDGKTFYWVDSAYPPIYQADYNLETSELTNKRPLLDNFPELGGIFDGATIDSEGYLWWAIFGGNKIIRIDPKTGEIERWVDLSGINMQRTTSITFGGDDYRDMLITSCARHAGMEDLTEGNNGGVAIIRWAEEEGIKGVPPAFWNEGK